MKTLSVTLLLLIFTLATSCGGNKVYDRYADVSVSGWESRDSLVFDVPKANEGGTYDITLGTRITSSYPFKSITLLVRTVTYPSIKTQCDTVECALIGDNGRPFGEGVSVFENTFPVCSMHVNEGDSLHISVTHNMRLEDLPGITAIGITARKAR